LEDVRRGVDLAAAADVLEHALAGARRNQDLEDAYRDAEYQEMLGRSALFTDRDLMAAGLPVG
jgi:hypothetical protein